MNQNKREKINQIAIKASDTILMALRKMDKQYVRLLFVMDGETFVNLVSIGDIQRAIINNFSLDTPVNKIFRKKVLVAKVGYDYDKVKTEMLENKTECMPVIDDNKKLVDTIFWEDLFKDKKQDNEILNLHVVIMAGGKGIRMRPITNIIPKPLIPIDDKTIIEHIIDNFQSVGCDKFYLSVNYKSDMIIDYFNKIDKNYKVEFISESKPLGTGGSLFLLKDLLKEPFFISNCDILINDDYRKIYNYHNEFQNELTVVASLRHYSIPYGTIETIEDGKLVSLHEKPELSFLINSGMYLLEPHLLDEIPDDQFFNITDLINNVKERGGKVGVFPVSEKSWIDIGEWDKYLDFVKFNYNK